MIIFRKKIKYFLKDIDQKYLGGLFFRTLRVVKKSDPEIVTTPEQRAIAYTEVVRQVQRPLPCNKDIKRVEILVLTFQDPEVEVKSIQHLIENTAWPYKITILDNRPGVKNMSKIWNKVIRESTCDYIAIMDSDAFVPKLEPCWLTRCMETFQQHPDCIAVSPVITKTSSHQQRASKPANRSPEKITEIFANMCVVYKKDGFEKMGYFDEDFLLYGPDSEWAHRLLRSSWSAYLQPDVLVDHIGHYSNKKQEKIKGQEVFRAMEKEYAAEIFRKKTTPDA